MINTFVLKLSHQTARAMVAAGNGGPQVQVAELLFHRDSRLHCPDYPTSAWVMQPRGIKCLRARCLYVQPEKTHRGL
ncbi:hypothetical protein AG1IA_08050 [Rhizoctonia solani AG-1 IA]|uniref:Uncharacterized protein n=1 Tax=Thanatephorus cucumeris (strain AG1-IA) TaxID=983506 RepID=L8WMC2_THACA|nr:hypothetical protein AG1IA_08050 [Rhizoctonia solani AG-1 IA]